jgi:hypothetical protein
MHSKLQLLKYPDHLRIVVPTGNLVAYDWGETGVMENVGALLLFYTAPSAMLTDPTHDRCFSS